MGKIDRNSIFSAMAIACLSLCLSSAAFAAGLGRLTVLSALGEPLKAEIEIVSLQQGEGDSLSARLGSVDAFRQANIELNGALLPVRFAIDRRSSTNYVVTMSSVQPMNEPFIDMLVELSWASGRLVREYTFLLDPPEYKGPVTASVPAVVAPVVPAVAPSQPAPLASGTVVPVPERAVAAPAKPVAAAATPAQPKSAPAGTHEVKRGDTLAKIAQQNMLAGATLQQMLVALYRGNSDAFDGANMNRLRTGKILNLPDKAAIDGISATDAQRLFSAQSAEYAQYRRSLGAAVADTPARPDTGRQASGQIRAPAPEKAAPIKEAAKDQLRLSRADDAKAGSRAAAAKDDSAAKDKAIKEANERIASLEKNIAEMKKLAELKTQAGAQLQQQALAAKAAPAVAPTAKPEDSKAATAPAISTPAPAADTTKAESPVAAPEAPKAVEVPKAVPPKAVPRPAAPPPEPPSFVDELLENQMALGGAGAVVVLLAGYAGYAVRRKRKQAAEAAAASSVMGIEPSMNSMLGATAEAVTDSAVAPAESSVGVSNAAPTDNTEEIDPVAEADVYMAYGRDTQAEEILMDALSKTPGHLPARLKLLEIYANRKDASSFETNAKELHSLTSGQGAEWTKAAALGLTIDPGNALYGGAAGAGSTGMNDTQILDASSAVSEPEAVVNLDSETAAQPALDFDLDGGAPATGAQPDIDLSADAIDLGTDVNAVESQPEAAPAALDFDLDLGGDKPVVEPNFTQDETVVLQPEAAPDAAMSIDFDLPTTLVASPAETPVESPAAEAASIDFDIGLPGEQPVESSPGMDFDLGTPADKPGPEGDAPMLDLSSINLDLGTEAGIGGAEPTAQWQEVATKLDLAKAYQDMGDKDGARELLSEVLQEGDAAQKEQANTMLSAIS